MNEKIFQIIISVLLAIVGFFGSQTYAQIIQIQKDLVDMKIKLTKIQSQKLTEQKVNKMIYIQIHKFLNTVNPDTTYK